MESLWQDGRHGVRLLVRNPGFTLAALATLALGIGANSAVFSVIDTVLLRPLPYPDSDGIVRVAERLPQMRARGPAPSVITNHTFPAWRAASSDGKSIESLAAYSPRSHTFTSGNEPLRLSGTAVSPEMFALLRTRPALGRLLEPGDDAARESLDAGSDSGRHVVLSDALWRAHFEADTEVIGRVIALDEDDYTVVGVTPPGFYFPDPETELWTPLVVPQAASGPGEHSVMALPALARLAPGVSLEQAASIGATIASRNPFLAQSDGVGLRLVSVREELVSGMRPALLVFAAAVAFVLLIATANIANLLIARGAGRRAELAVRAALGASGGRLARQLLTESALLGVLGGALGVIVAGFGLRVLIPLLPASFPRGGEIGVDLRVLGFALLVSALASVLFGLAPALRAARAEIWDSLGDTGPSGGAARGGRLRAALAISEVALALVLLIGAGLLVRSFARLVDVDPGYDPANVLTARVDLPERRYSGEAQQQFFDTLLSRLNEDPRVVSAGISHQLPLLPGQMIIAFQLPGRPRVSRMEDMPRAGLRIVSPGYRTAIGTPLIAGRDLSDEDSRDRSPAIVVNEAFVRTYLPDQDPLSVEIPGIAGQRGRTARIVGVLADVRHTGMDSEPQPEVYISYRQADSLPGARRGPMIVVRTTADPVAFAPTLRAQLASLDSQLALGDVMTMEQRVSASIAEPRLYAVLLGAFSALALILAAIGVSGVLAYTVSQRRREIGVRMALGARADDILRMVVGEGLRMTAIGVACGLIAALFLAPFLESLLFGVVARDALTFVAVPTGLVLIALLACGIPARRAARIDPMETLRSD
jgi:predicted permease